MSQTAATAPVTAAVRPATTHTRRLLPDLLAGSAYLLTGLPLAVISFSLLLTGTALALGTFAIVVGFAVMALALAIAQGFAALERARVGAVTGRPLPAARYRPLRDGTVGSVLSAGADPRRWPDLVHGLVSFPVALVTFVLTTVWWSAGIGGTGYVLWEWALPGEGGDEHRRGLAELLGWAGRAADIGLTTAIGIVMLLTLPLVVRACVAVQTGLARALLAGPDPT
ncbi:MAG: sensor domain-containing protein [Mycobacteriales bacterium]